MVITARTRVAEVLERDPDLLSVFIAASPAFSRLRHRAMRRVMSRLVTVEEAARVAGMDPAALLDQLNVGIEGGGMGAGASSLEPTGAATAEESRTEAGDVAARARGGAAGDDGGSTSVRGGGAGEAGGPSRSPGGAASDHRDSPSARGGAADGAGGPSRGPGAIAGGYGGSASARGGAVSEAGGPSRSPGGATGGHGGSANAQGGAPDGVGGPLRAPGGSAGVGGPDLPGAPRPVPGADPGSVPPHDGEGDADPTSDAEPAPAATPVLELDVREDLRNGREPFSRIMAAAARVPAGGILRLRAIFEPVPLYRVMATRGFTHTTEALAPDDWLVLFVRDSGAGTDADTGPAESDGVRGSRSVSAPELPGGDSGGALPAAVTAPAEGDPDRAASAPVERDPATAAPAPAGSESVTAGLTQVESDPVTAVSAHVESESITAALAHAEGDPATAGPAHAEDHPATAVSAHAESESVTAALAHAEGDPVAAAPVHTERHPTPTAPDTIEPLVILDVRDLDPPEPLVRTLAALDGLPSGATLVQLNHRVPVHLLPRLEQLGFEYETDESTPALVRTSIRRRGGG